MSGPWTARLAAMRAPRPDPHDKIDEIDEMERRCGVLSISSILAKGTEREAERAEPPPSCGAPDLPPPTRLPLGWTAEDWRLEYEERAAIREHCGRLSKGDAEAFALGDLVGEMLAASDAELRAELRPRLLRALGLGQEAA